MSESDNLLNFRASLVDYVTYLTVSPLFTSDLTSHKHCSAPHSQATATRTIIQTILLIDATKSFLRIITSALSREDIMEHHEYL